MERASSGRRTTSAKRPAAFDDLRDLLAFHQRLQRGQHLRRRHTVLRCCRVVDAHLDLRCQHLLFDLKVDEPRDGGQPGFQDVGLTAQRIQVFAEDLDRDLRTHAREHVVDAVRDRLADLQRSGQRALKHQSPIQALQKGRSEKPELFSKRVQKQPGLDSLAASADGLRR